ncbi:hypothetical protein BKA83DRAFT_679686 [Pisolithus microcarpus]|nr:hypothetical protein BKA83DRAFT_679686 [Pisolithus microcarpus]
MAPTRNASRMKQGTLSFQAAKRANSALNPKSQKPVASSSSKQELDTKTLSHPSVEVLPSSIPSKRTRDGVQPRRGSREKHAPKKEEGFPSTPEPERLDTEDKAGRYHREKMGYAHPIHGNGGNKIIQMLRFFDMTYEYGPCVGMTRLERWERAEGFGSQPTSRGEHQTPAIRTHADSPVYQVRQILSTKEGMEKEEYAQCVLFGEV